ncbi:PCDH9: Protocadherin-9 [Crotalus adamanteus]|uniref:PCDH9: Protocadherin-9 n=1 Tax=Crotalus adamanteus TaxID=8729 RepID=A0AAW1AVM0_CROAD
MNKRITQLAIEVNLQKALTEASETCTQECLILGHSDNCWMPPSLTQYQQSNPPLPAFGFQQGWVRGAISEGRHTLGRAGSKEDTEKSQGGFYNACDRLCTSEDPVKLIPLASFIPPAQAVSASGSSAPLIHEHQL